MLQSCGEGKERIHYWYSRGCNRGKQLCKIEEKCCLIHVQMDHRRNRSRLISWSLRRVAEDCNLVGSTVLRYSPGCSLHLHGMKMRIWAPAAHLQSFSHFSPPNIPSEGESWPRRSRGGRSGQFSTASGRQTLTLNHPRTKPHLGGPLREQEQQIIPGREENLTKSSALKSQKEQ